MLYHNTNITVVAHKDKFTDPDDLEFFDLKIYEVVIELVKNSKTYFDIEYDELYGADNEVSWFLIVIKVKPKIYFIDLKVCRIDLMFADAEERERGFQELTSRIKRMKN